MKSAPDWIWKQPIAHRGLHNAGAGVIENTLPAFAAAGAHNYAIELDVLPSADGEAMVFHDGDLMRLCGDVRNVSAVHAGELQNLAILNSTARIPTLSAVLELIDGRVPLLIEIKSLSKNTGALEERVESLLARYAGPAAVQSFNPLSMQWFAKRAPNIPRGQLSMRTTHDEAPGLTQFHRFALTNLMSATISKPDFIGYEASSIGDAAPQIARRLGLPLLAWTVRSAEQWRVISARADNLIFEGFLA